MRKSRPVDVQAAQGMVEFALVLPILLLLILGVFAFGHLFFAYTSVVSASREAARWGAAVGVADSMRPRYRDCPAIRGQAVRVGSFAGVAADDGPDDPNTAGIYIGFDHGPTDPDPDFDDCADDEGPAEIAYGDRINVRVTVNYRPVVPFVNIPEFPLTATSSRTIIRSLPVGEQPLAEPACRSTVIFMEMIPVPAPAILPADPVVGQAVNIALLVSATNGVYPAGYVDVNDELGHTCRINVPGETTCNLIPVGAYTEVGIHYITARFTPTVSGLTCYRAAEIIDEPLNVIKADTITTILSDNPDPSWPGEEVVVRVQVAADNPGAGNPVGGLVTISDSAGGICSVTLVDDINGIVSCTMAPATDVTYTASYAGDDNFNPSPISAPEPHTMRVAATETADPGDPTASVEPTLEETPDYCPSVVSGSFQTVTNGGRFTIHNPSTDIEITSIRVVWPSDAPKLREARFGPDSLINTCADSGPPSSRTCLWQYMRVNDRNYNPFAGLSPTTTTLSSSVNNWSAQAAGFSASADEVLMLLFTGVPTSGDYEVTVRFSNACVLRYTDNYAPSTTP